LIGKPPRPLLPVLHEPGRLESLADLKGAGFVAERLGQLVPIVPRTNMR
jgi:hypothetical protein